MLRPLRNILRYQGWSFRANVLSLNKQVVHEGESIILSSVILNNGVRQGTPYVRFLVADSYRLDQIAFDSHRDLPGNERSTLRLLNMRVRECRRVACDWVIPVGSAFKHCDIRVEVWNPHLLFNGPQPFLFHEIGWTGGFEVVVARPNTPPALRVFISYSWDSESHKKWVGKLVEELRKHNIEAVFDQKDLFPGEEATRFMERGISENDVTILICTENYTRKADNREPGGVGFETIISSHEYQIRTSQERARFIPIIRDNSLPKGKKLPKYLGSAVYVDMGSGNWHAEPMLDLVNAIRRHM